MYIGIPHGVHFRCYENNVYLFDQHRWITAFIKNIELFRALFSYRPVLVEEVATKIAESSGMVLAAVLADIHELIDPLIADGYFVRGDKIEIANDSNGRLLINRKTTAENSSKGHVNRIDDRILDDDDKEDGLSALMEYCIDNPTPFELCIDLTRACTERCVHCYVPGFQNVFLPCETIEKVFAEFAVMGGLKVKLTGGECMLHPDFERILFLANTYDLVISVLSNLTCCDEAKARAMKAAGVAVVQVSLYGMTAETHESVTRVKGSLEKTMRGIDCLRSAGVPVQIHCPVLRQNVSGIGAVARFGRKMGMKTTFDAVMMSRADHGRSDDCGLSDGELKRFIQSHEDLSNAPVSCPDVDADARVCEVGTAKICLSAEGKYYPCNGCYGYELGDCRRQTLAEVWNDEPIQRLRELRMRDLVACSACKNREFCAPCPARNFNANGNVSLPDQAMCRAAACRREIVESE